jgi:hypothetical protein
MPSGMLIYYRFVVVLCSGLHGWYLVDLYGVHCFMNLVNFFHENLPGNFESHLLSKAAGRHNDQIASK